MATTQAALQKMSGICLSLPDVVEGDHFGETCYRVRKKIFASCGDKGDGCRVVVQLEPDHARELIASDPRVERYTRQANCVSLDVSDRVDWELVRTLVLESYRLNAPGDPPPRKASATTRKKRSKGN